jgi:hypothetical protein
MLAHWIGKHSVFATFVNRPEASQKNCHNVNGDFKVMLGGFDEHSYIVNIQRGPERVTTPAKTG